MGRHERRGEGALSRRQALGWLGLFSLSAVFGAPLGAQAKKAKKKRYKIVFKLNRGKNPKSQKKAIEAGKKLAVKKLKKPTRHGYSFKGWFTDSALTKKAKWVKGKKRAASRTVYAKWALATYKIGYELGGGTLLFDLPTSYTCLSPTIALTGAVRAGHSFGGWYSDKKHTTQVEQIAAGSAGNMTLYAKWNKSSYWDTHLAAKTKRINELAAQIGAGAASLVFITDMHYPDNVGFSPELIKRVVAATPVEHVVFGGDAISYESDRQRALDWLCYARDALSCATFHAVRGNHDSNDDAGLVLAGTRLTDAELCASLGIDASASASDEQTPTTELCYVYDEPGCKVRHIFLDTCHPGKNYMKLAQTAWLKARIMELEAGWTVLVYMHQLFSPSRASSLKIRLALDPNGAIVCDALDEIYDDAKATIAAVIGGHVHRDYVSRSEKGYMLVTTTCDSYAKAPDWDMNYPSRTRGTVREQAFDVVQVDTKRGMLYFTRIGCGYDRAYAYRIGPGDDLPAVNPQPEDPTPIEDEPVEP